MFLSRNVNKWDSFIHNGVLFPDPYKPHNIPIIYNGKKVVLDKWNELISELTNYLKILENIEEDSGSRIDNLRNYEIKQKEIFENL